MSAGSPGATGGSAGGGGINAQQMQYMGMSLMIGSGIGDIASSYINAGAQRHIQNLQFQLQSEYRQQVFEYNKKAYAENYRRVNASVAENYKQIQQRIQQEAVAAAEQIGAIERQSKSVQAASTAGAAERGVDQGTQIIDAIIVNELRSTQAINKEQEWRLEALKAGMKEVEAQAEARIAGATPQPLAPVPLPAAVRNPNPFAKVIATMADTLTLYAQFQPQVANERLAANL
tara:strand:- start:1198 stop:1893 length:696 start_codon:yes stop_codon:yes gene_type:complete